MDKSTNASDALPRQRVSTSKAAASIDYQLDLDESSDLEVKEHLKDKVLSSTRKERVQVKIQYGKNKFRARASSIKGSPTNSHYDSDDAVSTTSVVVSTSPHRPGPLSTDKKGLLCISTDPSLITESDASDLTSLPSTTTSPIDNIVPRPPLCTPSKVVPLVARRGLEYGQLAELNGPAWSVNDLGSYVWVLLEPKSNRVYDPDRDENDFKERLWWPAKVCVCTSILEMTVLIQMARRFTVQGTLMSLSKSPYLDPDLRRWKLKPHLLKMFCLSWT